MDDKIIKVGRVELYESEAEMLYVEHRYIVAYRNIYQLNYSTAQKRIYGRLIYRAEEPMTRRGRWYAMTAWAVNHLLGYKLLIEDED